MIALGLDNQQKSSEVARYRAAHDISRIVCISPEKFKHEFAAGVEHVEWTEVIQYKHFYRLLQEIDGNTLVVVNECLRTQNRYDLTYNCIRHFLNQTRHQLVFQYLPIIDTVEDFMVLFDFDTQSRWKRESFRPDLLKECELFGNPVDVRLNPVSVPVDENMRSAYAKEKRKLIDGIGLKDPHTIPRNLYLMSGKAKLQAWSEVGHYVGRNNRFKLPNLDVFKSYRYSAGYTVFEFCHNFIDFVDFLSLSRQSQLDALVSELKVDHWYFERYMEWTERLRNAYASLLKQDCARSCA